MVIFPCGPFFAAAFKAGHRFEASRSAWGTAGWIKSGEMHHGQLQPSTAMRLDLKVAIWNRHGNHVPLSSVFTFVAPHSAIWMAKWSSKEIILQRNTQRHLRTPGAVGGVGADLPRIECRFDTQERAGETSLRI